MFENPNLDSAPGVDISFTLRLGLHFYAGHNLRTPEGYNIGTLCLFDGPPRHFPPAERHLLGQLAALVMHLLELRRIMGPHSGLMAMLWGTIYRSMSGQLAVLSNPSQHAASAQSQLARAVAQEAGAVVANLDRLVTPTMRRK